MLSYFFCFFIILQIERKGEREREKLKYRLVFWYDFNLDLSKLLDKRFIVSLEFLLMFEVFFNKDIFEGLFIEGWYEIKQGK